MCRFNSNLGTVLLVLTVAFEPIQGWADRLHLIIPAGPGGGLDATARALGNAMVESGLSDGVSYENRTGGGGGKAMAYFVTNGSALSDTLLVNSAPLIIRSLQGLFPQSYRDLTPIAGLIADPGVIAVRADSPFQSWNDLAQVLTAGKERLFVGGGSVKGSLDHITLSLVAQAAGINPRGIRYLAYDGGAKAQLALLSGEVDVMVSGLGETLAAHRAGSVRILGMTDHTNPSSDVPIFVDQGIDVVFFNWRGVFAPGGLDQAEASRLEKRLTQLTTSDAWQQQLARYGWQPLFLPGEEFITYLEAQEYRLAKVMGELGLIK